MALPLALPCFLAAEGKSCSVPRDCSESMMPKAAMEYSSVGSPPIHPGEHRAKNGLNLNASGWFPQHLPTPPPLSPAQPDVCPVLWVLRGAPCGRCAVSLLLFPVPWAEGRLCCLAPGTMAFCLSLEGGVASRLAPGKLGHPCCQVPSPSLRGPGLSLREVPGSLLSRRPLSGHSALPAVRCYLAMAFQGNPLCLYPLWSRDLNCEPTCSTSNQTHMLSMSLRTGPEGWGLLRSPTGGRLVNKGGLEQW